MSGDVKKRGICYGKNKMLEPVTPIASVFIPDERLFEPCAGYSVQTIGLCTYVSSVLPFDHTDYYTTEMGQDLKRRIFLAGLNS